MRSQFNHVQLFVTLWTVTLQAPLSMGFSRWEYWSTYSMPCPPSRDFPGHQESNWCLRCLLHCRTILCPLSHLGSPCKKVSNTKNGEGNGNWPQYSHLENSMDRGAWQATVHGVTKSRIWLSNWTTTISQSKTLTRAAVLPTSQGYQTQRGTSIWGMSGLNLPFNLSSSAACRRQEVRLSSRVDPGVGAKPHGMRLDGNNSIRSPQGFKPFTARLTSGYIVLPTTDLIEYFSTESLLSLPSPRKSNILVLPPHHADHPHALASRGTSFQASLLALTHRTSSS